MARSEAMSKKMQESFARRGEIVGDEIAVGSTLRAILQDGRFRKLQCVYSASAAKRGKVPGQPYNLTARGGVKPSGKRSSHESARRSIDNGLLSIFCVDHTRQGQWRTAKINCIKAIQVFSGRTINGKAESKMVKVKVI